MKTIFSCPNVTFGKICLLVYNNQILLKSILYPETLWQLYGISRVKPRELGYLKMYRNK